MLYDADLDGSSKSGNVQSTGFDELTDYGGNTEKGQVRHYDFSLM